jgi:exosome complex RNA-binding protein Rrp42 (RNase PH superfamily)
MCGIGCEVGIPTDKEPNGEFIVNIHLPGIASQKFHNNRNIDLIKSSIKTFIDTILKKMLDDSELDIIIDEKKVAVWVLYCDIYCIEHDGNLYDSSLLSVVTALQDGRFIFYF